MDSQTKTVTTVIGVAAALSYLWTTLRDFWYDNFFAPLLADARGAPVNGVTATYNTYNTILYAFLFYIGYLIIRNLIYSQAAILKDKNKGAFFLSYLNRLFLYGIPVALGLWKKNYLTLSIILVFLFSFQVIYLGFEIGKSRKGIKRK